MFKKKEWSAQKKTSKTNLLLHTHSKLSLHTHFVKDIEIYNLQTL